MVRVFNLLGSTYCRGESTPTHRQEMFTTYVVTPVVIFVLFGAAGAAWEKITQEWCHSVCFLSTVCHHLP